ncbi:MAG: hypothetical protein F6J98_10425 [Moorea sp. SIO4G2]|uniref:hypothetical protein n=1 Tax=unclassified Moorena TaxID=2683338 RepID=UPI0013CC264D|nr:MULTISPECIES: hypothetical protein [unclassified Moorena]NEO48762.1 hypothetical protein [Moorena sp. SIO4A3]NEO60824.1 hypothetical protein [Moorena sp. SIO4G2]NEQ04028.1 hypothetical protein [Moorena sp. SIO3F7]NEO17490.1 hypothetical protein [Moorena sp. SIO3E8]NEO24887.1 hypothetical protein [Moorena sp. SIO4A5]
MRGIKILAAIPINPRVLYSAAENPVTVGSWGDGEMGSQIRVPCALFPTPCALFPSKTQDESSCRVGSASDRFTKLTNALGKHCPPTINHNNL